MAKRLPNIDCLFLPEAAVKDLYFSGDKLVNRRINILEFGRSNGKIHDEIFEKKIKSHYFPLNNKHLFHTSEEFAKALSDSKIAIVLPRNMTHPQIACGIETLTQRYWECMFSRCLMVGHAPDELVNLIGYNPVIEISNDNAGQQVSNIINNIEEYQSLVDKNYEIACQYGDWNSRLVELSNILNNRGYLLR